MFPKPQLTPSHRCSGTGATGAAGGTGATGATCGTGGTADSSGLKLGDRVTFASCS